MKKKLKNYADKERCMGKIQISKQAMMYTTNAETSYDSLRVAIAYNSSHINTMSPSATFIKI